MARPVGGRSALDGYWDGFDQHVNYIDAQGHVRELYNGQASSGKWLSNDLTQLVNGLPAASRSAVDGYWDGSGQHVNFFDANFEHAHEFYNGAFSAGMG